MITLYLLLEVIQRIRRTPWRALVAVMQVLAGSLAVSVAIALARGATPAEQDTFQIAAGASMTSTYSLFQVSDLASIKAAAPDVEALEGIERIGGISLVARGKRYKLRTGYATGPNLPQIIDINWIAGSFPQGKRTASDRPVAISADLSRRLFGDTDVLGETVLIGFARFGQGATTELVPHQVVGVFSSNTDRLALAPHLFMSLASLSSGYRLHLLVGVATPGQGSQASAQVLEALRQTYSGEANFKGVRSAPGSGLIPSTTTRSDAVIALFIGIAAVTLLICTIGLFSTVLFSSAEREQEFATKRALGATRGQIFLECWLEPFIQSLFGTALGITLAIPTLRMLSLIAPTLLGDDLQYSNETAVITFVLVVLVCSLSSVYPATVVLRFLPARLLRA
jgi:ABC-type antimicrobial peptide transport system permease subunit